MDQIELEGMPRAATLRLVASEGQVLVAWGNSLVCRYESDDNGMRNLVIVALTDAGRRIDEVARIFGLTATYVSILRGRAHRDGSAGLVKRRGRPRKLSERQVARAGSTRMSRSARRRARPHRYAGPRPSTPRSRGCASRCRRSRTGRPVSYPSPRGPAPHWPPSAAWQRAACPPPRSDPCPHPTRSYRISGTVGQTKSPAHRARPPPTCGGLRPRWASCCPRICPGWVWWR